MKIILYKILIMSFLILFSKISIAHEIQTYSKIEKFNFRNCKKSECIQILADRAESGYLSSVVSLKKVEIRLFKNGKKIDIQGSYGYLDFDNNIVSVRLNVKDKEMLIDLNNFKTREYKL